MARQKLPRLNNYTVSSEAALFNLQVVLQSIRNKLKAEYTYYQECVDGIMKGISGKEDVSGWVEQMNLLAKNKPDISIDHEGVIFLLEELGANSPTALAEAQGSRTTELEAAQSSESHGEGNTATRENVQPEEMQQRDNIIFEDYLSLEDTTTSNDTATSPATVDSNPTLGRAFSLESTPISNNTAPWNGNERVDEHSQYYQPNMISPNMLNPNLLNPNKPNPNINNNSATQEPVNQSTYPDIDSNAVLYNSPTILPSIREFFGVANNTDTKTPIEDTYPWEDDLAAWNSSKSEPTKEPTTDDISKENTMRGDLERQTKDTRYSASLSFSSTNEAGQEINSERCRVGGATESATGGRRGDRMESAAEGRIRRRKDGRIK